MTKGAINALTLSLSSQLASRGITINAILPGFVATDMNAGMLQDPDSYRFGADYSMFGRWGAGGYRGYRGVSGFAGQPLDHRSMHRCQRRNPSVTAAFAANP